MNNIVLCGMPASGKTTISAALGELYDKTVVDTDAVVVQKYGEINKIFDEFGEKRFREMETEAVESCSELNGAVIATGGGCVLSQKNVDILKSGGKIFYLRAKRETLIKRVRGDTARPLLRGNAAERIDALLAARSEKYEQAADFIIDVDSLTPEEIAKKITEFME